MSRRKPNSPPPEKKYRIVEVAGEYYPQYKFLWFWVYYKAMLPCSSDIVYERLHFHDKEGAAQYIREEIFQRLKERNKKSDRKIISYFDDTGYEF